MKAVAYSIKPEKETLQKKANQKKHDITLISNALALILLVGRWKVRMRRYSFVQ